MKKNKLFIAIALVVCVVSVFALCACKMDVTVESNATAENYEDTVELVNYVIHTPLENKNFVVTANVDGRLYFTETVVGDNDYFVYANSNNASYAIKDGEEYVTISESDTNHYYISGKENYDDNYCIFYYQYIIDFIDECKDSGQFNVAYHMEEKDGDSTGKLSGSIVKDEEVTYLIDANFTDGLVKDITLTMDGGNGSKSSLSMTFAYGSASINVPDYKSWDK